MLLDGTKSHATPRSIEDQILLQRIAARDENAFRTIIERHGPAIYGVTQVILGDRALAQDLVEETLLELWERPGRFEASAASLRDNLRIVARAKAIDELRSLYDPRAASRRSAAVGRSSAR